MFISWNKNTRILLYRIYTDDIITKINYQDDKSMLIVDDKLSDINICTQNNETIVKYNKTYCNILCYEGKDEDGNLCGSCSSYKLFYWLSLLVYEGKCKDKKSNI